MSPRMLRGLLDVRRALILACGSAGPWDIWEGYWLDELGYDELRHEQ